MTLTKLFVGVATRDVSGNKFDALQSDGVGSPPSGRRPRAMTLRVNSRTSRRPLATLHARYRQFPHAASSPKAGKLASTK